MSILQTRHLINLTTGGLESDGEVGLHRRLTFYFPSARLIIKEKYVKSIDSPRGQK